MAKNDKSKKVKAKFVNRLNRGEDIFIAVNNKTWRIQDGATVVVPMSVIKAAENAIEIRYKIPDINIDRGDRPQAYTVKKIEAIIIDENPDESAQKNSIESEVLSA